MGRRIVIEIRGLWEQLSDEDRRWLLQEDQLARAGVKRENPWLRPTDNREEE